MFRRVRFATTLLRRYAAAQLLTHPICRPASGIAGGVRTTTNCGRCYSSNSNERNPKSEWQVSRECDSVKLVNDGANLSFLNIWLRDHCRCPECLHPLTKQKELDTFKIALNIEPDKVWVEDDHLNVLWPDSHQSCFSIDWLKRHSYANRSNAFGIENVRKTYWGKEISETLPEDIDFTEALHSEEELKALYRRIAEYGFAFINNVPSENKDFEKLLDRVGRVKTTHYGQRWEFTGGNVEFLDTAYLSVALGGHTDGTYFVDSPGLQVFHCKYHDGLGGENLLVDGINAALRLKESCPEAFEFLSTTPLPFVSYEENSIFRNSAPMIQVDPASEEVYHVRVNNYDRDVLSTLNAEDLKKFYSYLHEFYSILRSPQNAYWVKLWPGRPVIVDNWRVLHGRAAFTGTRTIYGCYLQRDEYISRARWLLQNE